MNTGEQGLIWLAMFLIYCLCNDAMLGAQTAMLSETFLPHIRIPAWPAALSWRVRLPAAPYRLSLSPCKVAPTEMILPPLTISSEKRKVKSPNSKSWGL
ncbi:hypothetical protein [Biostraticola tofi]|uniref:hypothetical protein n=1 Tax=Biostraticola tofi TaxID=466109 RepID=UPI00104CCDDC|nr:hypothetical protein [Biostraticola tofi]